MSKWTPFGTFKPGDLRVLGLGLELALAIGGLGWLGDWADHRWQTGPWLLLSGIILGTVGGCWNIYKGARKEGLLGPGLFDKLRGKKKPETQDGTDSAPTSKSDNDSSFPS